MDAIARPAAETALTHRETMLIVFGVMLPVFLGSLDNTILASALPSIGRDLGDLRSTPWLITAYLIAATAVMPLYGKVSDIHGRRVTLLAAISAYIVGSLICALAPNMLVLILGRAVHGLGGGGLTSMGMVVLGDIAAPKDRGKYYGYFSISFTTAGAMGPALGGFIAEYLHWSVIFWLNIPMGLIALALISRLLRRLPRHERPHRLDFIGAALIVAATVPFMIGLNLAGGRFAWMSPQIIALFVVAVAVAAGFVIRLVRAPEPLIPLSILREPVVRCAFVVHSFGWGSIVGLNIFLPMYLQSVMGLSVASAGLSLMVLMATLNASAGFAGALMGRMNRYKVLPLAGLTLALVSVATLAWQAGHLSPIGFEILLALIGIGFGPVPPFATVCVQNIVQPHQFGIALGTMNFSRSLFSTIIVAIFGAIVLTAASGISPGAPAAGALAGYGEAAVDAFTRVFIAAAASLSAALIGVMLIEARPLRAAGRGA